MLSSLTSLLVSALAVFPLVSSVAINHTHIDTGNNTHIDTGNKTFAAQASSFWLANIAHQGIATFNPNSGSYQVFRNVMDFGARGDGVTDDTNAINAAISSGSRCGSGCDSSTITPALIYFPAGTYLVSSPIIAMYYSQLIGDPTNIPTLKGSASFSGIAIVDADPYLPGGVNWYTNQNNFFRGVRNFVIDTTSMPASAECLATLAVDQCPNAIHWQVAQATSLINVTFRMSQAAGNLHQGIFMDNGSGGFMSDLTFIGGRYGAFLGNQQFATRNLVFQNCQTAIFMNWNWLWTLKSLNIQNCQVGIDMSVGGSGAQGVGSITILDSVISNTPIGVLTAHSTSSSPATGGSLILDHVQLTNVNQAVASTAGATILAGGSTTIDLWGQGHQYSSSGAQSNIQGSIARPFAKPSVLLDSTGKFVEKSHPQYTTTPASSFISVRSHGARGDGVTDDTAALQSIFNSFGGNLNNVIFFDHGVYLVSTTVSIPPNTLIVGEVWPAIMAAGSTFSDMNNPKPVFRIGVAGDVGRVEMSDMVFQTRGPQPGAILVEWNVADPSGAPASNGMWDTVFRVGGTAGTNLQQAQCTANSGQTSANTACEGAFMDLHIGKTATLYLENVWAWTADHNLDADPSFPQLSIYNGRGIYDESTNGPVWMYATAAEHNQLYQFEFANTKNVFIAMAQTETPYYQPDPTASTPFTSLSAWNDPSFSSCTTSSCAMAWALRVLDSTGIMVYSAGFYSFFQNYGQSCLDTDSCQDALVSLTSSQVALYNLNTIAATNMIVNNGASLAPSEQNVNGFAETVVEFSSS